MPYADPEQQREFVRVWTAATKAARRREWLEENGPCRHCGSKEDLEVDHIDPNQKVEHRLWTWSAARRATELAKCQVLCRPCHRLKDRERVAGLAQSHPGEAHAMSRLTADDIKVIRATVGRTHQSLASEYGVSRQHISKIRSGQKWSHL